MNIEIQEFSQFRGKFPVAILQHTDSMEESERTRRLFRRSAVLHTKCCMQKISSQFTPSGDAGLT